MHVGPPIGGPWGVFRFWEFPPAWRPGVVVVDLARVMRAPHHPFAWATPAWANGCLHPLVVIFLKFEI